MIQVLVVDDQPVVARAHRTFVDRVPGFRTVAVAGDGDAALARVARGGVDLVLLDLAMPGMHGLDVCRALRDLPGAPDVLVVTAARDLASVRTAVRHGVVHYLVKPFTFAALRARLEAYAAYRAAASGQGSVMDQGEIDAALAALRTPVEGDLAKGMSRETLDLVRSTLRGAVQGLTANETAAATGLSRVTARRYLEHLVSSGAYEREPVYCGRSGRPELRYRPR
ncbi:response regulator [Georgenia sp. SUBG003]|uniref:response regulator n=1 Tax=Georgenia sp. SUBG003 TaxID=1497974 RepID=UPI0004D64203|nr:chemotaxis protein CheY [Georgenia sp. SUBG003]